MAMNAFAQGWSLTIAREPVSTIPAAVADTLKGTLSIPAAHT
jgi:hypothetical protein